MKYVTHLTKLSLIICVFVFTNTAYAQQSTSIKPSVHIDISPKYPAPGQSVRATFRAPSIDMDTALVTWYLNGEILQQMYARESIEFKVGNVGSISTLTAVAKDGRNREASTKKIIQISDVAVLWEGRTYTPLFYLGRALQSPGSDIAVNVLPSVMKQDGSMYTAEELSYSWTTNYSNIPKFSGIGKHSIVLKNDLPHQPFTINVQVKDPSGKVRTTKKIEIPVTQPEILLYEDSSIFGIRHDKAISAQHGIYNREATFVAEPYHISATSRTDTSLEYFWTIAEEKYNSRGSLSFGSEDTVSGTTHLNLLIKNSSYWLQRARADVQINFGQREQWVDNTTETVAL